VLKLSYLQIHEKIMRGLRKFLYAFARLLGDASAAKRGKVGKRVGRRIVGKGAGRAIGKMFK